ncbi:MAG: energy-coupling factor ABC transporter permease [Bacillota bacterium]|nr:energy-coupling factor ABC transporter permease [Bacillota bacterium]MDW7683114.1 energy-coupling factor ABC transporter permease [Bacillota bacterium]
MAHIPEGVISGALAGYGFVLSGAVSVITGRKIHLEQITKVSMVTAAVFCASLLHFPFLGTSVHFTFVGLAGMLLGPASFLSVLVAVLFQGLLFQHGGISTLGVNAFNIGTAALAGYYIFRLRRLFPRWHFATTFFAMLAGFGAGTIMVVLLALTLLLTGFPAASILTLFVVYIPVIVGEGLASGFLAAALQKARKEAFFS